MNVIIEINKSYKQTIELTNELVIEANEFVNTALETFAEKPFQVELTKRDIQDILNENEDDPILIDNIVSPLFLFEGSVADFVKNFFIHLDINKGEVDWASPVEIITYQK